MRPKRNLNLQIKAERGEGNLRPKMGPPHFPRHPVVPMLAVALFLLVAGTCKGQRNTVTLKITNNMTENLGIRRVSDDGLNRGDHSIVPSATYEFSFYISEKIITRLYKCWFHWPNNVYQYTVYYQPREICGICRWFITAAGPCHFDDVTRKTVCGKWPNGSSA